MADSIMVVLEDNLGVAADGSEGEPVFVGNNWLLMPNVEDWVSLGRPLKVMVTVDVRTKDASDGL